MAYTNIDDPSAYFQTALWTGGNDASRTITNDGNSDLQPDWIWAKARTSTSYTDNHFSVDSSRGRLKGLVQNNTSAETTTTGNATQQAERDLVSFNSDGFTVGIVNSTAALNASSASHVAWQWKANGGTTSSNTDGATTSTVQANTDAGFSIVTWTGTGSATTLGHGLSDTPKMLIVKNRSTTVDWAVYHKELTNPGYVLALNNTDAQVNSGFQRWNRTHPTSSVFSVGTGQQTNENTSNMIAYCFAEKQGYSKFGKFVGNGNADGPFVYTGFKPAWLMIKNADVNGTRWRIIDAKINPTNVTDTQLFAEDTLAENTNSVHNIDLLSNGFKMRTSQSDQNNSGSDIIYMAFAESPFVTSTGIPTTAR